MWDVYLYTRTAVDWRPVTRSIAKNLFFSRRSLHNYYKCWVRRSLKKSLKTLKIKVKLSFFTSRGLPFVLDKNPLTNYVPKQTGYSKNAYI